MASFNYNTAVNNVNVASIHNTYNKTVIENTTVSRVSYHGGNGGIAVEPNAQERLAERDRHTNATQVQVRHEQSAGSNRAQRRLREPWRTRSDGDGQRRSTRARQSATQCRRSQWAGRSAPATSGAGRTSLR